MNGKGSEFRIDPASQKRSIPKIQSGTGCVAKGVEAVEKVAPA
jgi:hypothetical protein